MKLDEQKELNKLKNEVMRELQYYTFSDIKGYGEMVYVSDVIKAISAVMFKKEKHDKG